MRCGCSRYRFNMEGLQHGTTKFKCYPLRHQPDTDMPMPFSRCEFRMRVPEANGHIRSSRWIALPEDHYSLKRITIEGNVIKFYACTHDPCTVCFERCFDDHLKLKCKHYFHRHCLERWSKENPTCPNCKAPL